MDRPMRSDLTAEEVRRHFRYDRKTGLFWRGARQVGHRQSMGYTFVTVYNRRYLAHRLAWLYVYGVWPATGLDHINGVPTDNRICNLRLATKSQNGAGMVARNKNGYKGVHQHSSGKLFRAESKKDGVKHRGIWHKTPEKAFVDYKRLSKRLHGVFVKPWLGTCSKKIGNAKV